MESFVLVAVLIATSILTVIGQPLHLDEVPAPFTKDVSLENTKSIIIGNKKITLSQHNQSILNAALAAIAPIFGRIVKRVPIIGTATNAVTGTINNGIVNGFAIPLEDEYEYNYYYKEKSEQRKDDTPSQRKPQYGKSSQRKSRNYL